ncbi:cation:proton antiporter domain-containing protein [Nocardia pseudobrasiliensis]|nr:cation:proton antiporter [Nocardia pseudobrasiliensis]
MPLTMALLAVPAHWLAGLDWPAAFLLGAILSPTDPVFASAIVGRTDVPLRLRRLLNVESGLNDGLALPFVLIFLATDVPIAKFFVWNRWTACPAVNRIRAPQSTRAGDPFQDSGFRARNRPEIPARVRQTLSICTVSR